jgi:TIR domain
LASSLPSSESGDPAQPLGKEPLLFISYAHEDRALAECFSRLIESTTDGALKTFCASSDLKPGSEWFLEIMKNLRNATDLVALLTPNSIDRSWLHFEAGFVLGRQQLVFGVTFGITLAQSGAFAQFQNCSNDEESLIVLLILLMRRNLGTNHPQAEKIETIRRRVQVFRKSPELKSLVEARIPPTDGQEMAARMLEEVKLLARDLRRNSGPLLLGPMFSQEFPLQIDERFGGYEATGWLVFIGTLREDLPWLYELGLELYYALRSGDPETIAVTRERLLQAVRRTAHNPWLRSMIAQSNRDLAFRLFNLPDLIESYLDQIRTPAVGPAQPG